MAKPVRISLANKCQLLFGLAVLLILSAALAVGWYRMQKLVEEGQQETARRLADACLVDSIRPGGSTLLGEGRLGKGLTINIVPVDMVTRSKSPDAFASDPFLTSAIKQFEEHTDIGEVFRPAEDELGQKYYRYARAVRKSDENAARQATGAEGGYSASLESASYGFADPLRKVILVQLPADQAQKQLMTNRLYIVFAALLACILAIATFWFITTRIILSPVRVLRDTAAKVSEGDLQIRSDINTGDEFEQLSDMFNTMLENLKKNQDQLRAVNKSLDLKLGELAQTNVALYEANKIKGEFLANVSHELRTPLNSIIGFAEVLDDTIREGTEPVDEKRKRYIANIIMSSRRLLELINDLLDLAKIEAGRIDLHVAPMSVADTAEGLATLMRPLAEKRQIDLQVKLSPDLPVIQTDAGRLRQVLFNFLSNAIKFTPDGGTVTLSAAMIPTAGNATGVPPAASPPELDPQARVRISVTDTGPGIPPEEQERIFEKFIQIDSGVTKEYSGSGLGLAISKELARLLQGRIEVDSSVGRGATFSLIIPITLDDRTASLMPELVDTKK